MKLKNTLKTLSILAATGVLLTGCSNTPGGISKSFETQDYKSVTWDTNDFDSSSWPDGESGAGVLSPVTSLHEEGIGLTSIDNECTLYATIDYVESYKENRGDQFNSYEYLYTTAGNNTVNIEEVEVERIADVDFAVAEFEGVDLFRSSKGGIEEEEQQVYRKIAVRVFDKALPIPGAEEASEGLYGSDATEGLPAAKITVTCSDKESLTDELWKNGVDRLKFNWTGETALMPDSGDVEMTEEDKELLGDPEQGLVYEEVPVNDQVVEMGEVEILDDNSYEFVDDPTQADIEN